MASLEQLSRKFCLILILLLLGVALAPAGPFLRGNLEIHDPSTIIKCKNKYYIFGTGQGIISKSSSDKVFWSAGPVVFSSPPPWTTNAVPGFTGLFWAPDILFLNGQYCLYYAVSSWGSQVSAIGLVTNPTLDPADPGYHWTDQGMVIQSGVGSPYNTIDPSVTLDAAGNPWMSFGSYWNGIYIVQLDPLTGLRISGTSPTWRVAYNSSIEASCVCRRGSYYYLFVNWGSCCSGVNSTYNIRVGRSTSITGPYLDRNGVDMAANGGTLFLQGTGKFTGPGHVGVLSENGSQSFSYHYYDAGAWAPWYGAYGVALFDLAPLSWTSDNWPVYTNDWSAVYLFQNDARDEGGQYYGLLQGGASIQSDPVRGRVLNLNGTNQYVQLPPGLGYARTFSAVVKWNGGSAWQRIFDFGTDTSGYVMLTPSSGSGKLRCDIRANGITQTIEGPGPLPTGVWTHVGLTLDGQRGVLYVNGSPVTNVAITLSPVDVRAQTNHLGHSKFIADADFNGQFATFRVSGRALSAAEMVAPVPLIAHPVPTASVAPGSSLVFDGAATDYADMPLAAAALTWRVEYLGDGVTNVLFGPRSGITNGSVVIPADTPAVGLCRVYLTATEAGGARQRTVTTDVPVVSNTGADWASFYPFTSGAQDASNLFSGTLLNGASVQTDATRGKVLNLGGGSQYVNLPSGVGGLATFGGWVKWNGGNAWQRIFDFGQDTSHWFMLTPLDGDGKMQCSITTDRPSYVRTIQAPTTLATGAWTHLAMVLDGRQGILYSNGQAVAINNSVNLLPSDVAATRCWLGRSQYPADAYFNGQMDSVKLNSRALTAAELFAPTATITQPAPGALYAGGAVISYAGTATDYSDAPLPGSALSWSVEFHHDAMTDPFLGPTNGYAAGWFTVPTTGPSTTNAFYRLNLKATDAAGNQQVAWRDVLPRLTLVNLDTVPSGLQVDFDGQLLTTPTSLSTVAGLNRALSGPSPQSLTGSNYNFVVWSDGGSMTHMVQVPLTNSTYTASFVEPALVLSNAGAGGVLNLSWPAWAAAMNVYFATNLASPIFWQKEPGSPVEINGCRVLSLPATNGMRFYQLAYP